MSESAIETNPADTELSLDEKCKKEIIENIAEQSATLAESVQCPPYIPPHLMGYDVNNSTGNDVIGSSKRLMKPRFGVKVPNRGLTSQIVTQDEIAQELLERSLRKYSYQNVESSDRYFSMKLTGNFPNRIPLQSAAAAATVTSSTIITKNLKTETTVNEETRIKDNNELLAILDGNPEPSTVEKKNTVRKLSGKMDSKYSISPYKFIKMYPELEKELALKQLEEFSSKSRKKKEDGASSNGKETVQNRSVQKREKKSKESENNNNLNEKKLTKDVKSVIKGKPGRKRKIVPQQEILASPKKRRVLKSTNGEVQSTTVADVSQITEVPIVDDCPLPLVTPVKDNRYVKKYINKRYSSKSEDLDSSGNDVVNGGASLLENESDNTLVCETIVENLSPKIKKTVLKKSDIVVSNINNNSSNCNNNTSKNKVDEGHDCSSNNNNNNTTASKKKNRVMREIDKLLGDEGAINMLYSVEQKRTPGSTPNRRGILPSSRRKKKDLLLKTRLVKNAVLRLSSSPPQSLGKTALRARRDSSLPLPPPAIPLVVGSLIKEEIPERKLSVESLQSASLGSPIHSPSFAYPSKLSVPAEASRIIRRHSSSSSYSSRSNSPRRPSIDADRSLLSQSVPSSPEKPMTDSSGSISPKKCVLSLNDCQYGTGSISERAKQFLDAINDPKTTINELSERADRIIDMRVKEMQVTNQELGDVTENSCSVVFKKDIRNLVKSRLSAEVTKSLKRDLLGTKFIKTKNTNQSNPVSEIQRKFLKALSRQDSCATNVGAGASSTSTSPLSESSTSILGNENSSLQLPLHETAGYSNLLKIGAGDGQKKRDGEEKHRSSLRQNAGTYSYKEISLKRYEHLVQIILTPVSTKMKSAFNCQVFKEMTHVLNSLRKDDTCRVVLFTSTGSAFCLGIDLTALIHPTQEKRKSAAVELFVAMKTFIKSLATFTKPLIAGVHGAAVGLGVTMLPFFDMVFASDKATFHTPYARLGQIPEGAATVTLPQMLGNAVTSELLFGCRKLTASEALHFGLVTRILWPDRFQEELIPLIRGIATQSSQSMEATKALLRHGLCAKLDNALMSEAQFLINHWQSDECQSCFKQYLEEETPTLQK